MKLSSNVVWPIVLIIFWGWVISPGKFIGTLFPVVSGVEAFSEPDPENSQWVILEGSFIKHRNDCRPLRLEWVLGTRVNPGPPIEYVWGKPEIRLEGIQVFENWRVRAAPPETLHNETFADVLHKCGVTIGDNRIEFPWETRTAFWN